MVLVERQETRANQEWCVTDVAGGIAEQWRDSGPRTAIDRYMENVEHSRVEQPSSFQNYCIHNGRAEMIGFALAVLQQ
ncbi:hypothetical protein I7I48_10687 [Histoplasma ohiense]|nr:hypothetical protein I7I48_10687 [Histoplasma ohiense (nom. inval.)]